jgi:hypothetical protein
MSADYDGRGFGALPAPVSTATGSDRSGSDRSGSDRSATETLLLAGMQAAITPPGNTDNAKEG